MWNEEFMLPHFLKHYSKYADRIFIINDHSTDKTVEIARQLGIQTYVHSQNRGYGGNQKTCYTIALSQKADIVVMIHPDYQYDSKLIPDLVAPIARGQFDVMLGSRIRTRKEALDGGMPPYKYYFNRFLTIIQNILLGLNLSEYHTGFRAFSSKSLKEIPFHKFSDNFVFDQQILIYAHRLNLKIGEIPVPVRYFPEASSINIIQSTIYGLGILGELFKYIIVQKQPYK